MMYESPNLFEVCRKALILRIGDDNILGSQSRKPPSNTLHIVGVHLVAEAEAEQGPQINYCCRPVCLPAPSIGFISQTCLRSSDASLRASPWALSPIRRRRLETACRVTPYCSAISRFLSPRLKSQVQCRSEVNYASLALCIAIALFRKIPSRHRPRATILSFLH